MDSLTGYLTDLSSESPAPGGGSAATIVAAAGGALVAMVARINLANPRYEAWHALARRLVRTADRLREEFLDARRRDEAAFGAVVAAQALPKANEAEKATRRSALEAALFHAAAEPLACARQSLDVLKLAALAAQIPNANLVSDVGCAAEFAAAAVAACAYNVRVNHRFMRDAVAIAAQAETLARYERETVALLQSVRCAVTVMLTT